MTASAAWTSSTRTWVKRDLRPLRIPAVRTWAGPGHPVSNKLFLSRPARKPFYADAFRRLLPEALERERLELHRSEIDVFGDTWPKVGTALKAIAERAAALGPAAPVADESSAARVAMAEAAAAAAEARVFFANQAVHHLENLEGLYATVHAALRPVGIFHLHEFVGPSRFQRTDAQPAAVNNYLFSLPPHLRRLPDGQSEPPLYRPTVEAMIAADPSKAVRPADVLTALDHLFEVVERRELGGTLLHLALGDIAQNFDAAEPEDRCQLERLFDLEDRMIMDGLIRSDFVVVTAVPRQAETHLPASLLDRSAAPA